MDTYYCVVLVVLHLAVVKCPTPAVFSVQNVVEGKTATFECSFSGITSASSLLIKKDGVTVYGCGSITFTCNALSGDTDYSEVTFTGSGTTSGKGTFTVDNADQVRDGGIWVCEYGTSLESDPVTFVVNARPTAIFSVQNVVTGKAATFECTSSLITSTSSLEIKKDGVLMYGCASIASTCNALSGDTDYSKIAFTGSVTTSRKGIFTVDNADQVRDGGIWVCEYGTSLESDPVTFVVNDPTPARLSVKNLVKGKTATFECTSSFITSTSSLEIKNDGVLKYGCASIASTCNALSGDSDYSDVTFTGIGTTSGKGTFTVDNADQARDGGSWACKYDTSLESDTVTFVVNETDNDTCACWYYWLFILVLIPCVGLVVVIIIVSRYKTLVISTLYVNVTKNIVKLKLKPEFEPVPNTTYATCAQNGLTENAEFIDGLLVVEFRHLIPERQHDVTIYCQNPADMKLYMSETFVVFTLKDSSNTNPKESSPVLALHLLDLTVSQRNVGLSWTSPIAFESTKVEYWFGSGKHITISAKKPSQVTSNAEMTRLLPERMITFTITGEKDGTKYPSGTFHQKTLKD